MRKTRFGQAPARIDTSTTDAGPAPLTRVSNYRRSFNNAQRAEPDAARNPPHERRCRELAAHVDPSTLTTAWNMNGAGLALTPTTRRKRYAIHGRGQIASEPALNGRPQSPAFNAGLSHSTKDGSFITGDLCPSRKPLDRTCWNCSDDRAADASGARNLRSLADQARRRFPMAAGAGALWRLGDHLGQPFLPSPLCSRPPDCR